MTGTVAKKVLQMIPAAKNADENKVHLTQKEISILNLMVQGYSYKMIASSCYISLDTVRGHIRNIYTKLHVNCGREAVAKALKDRIV